MPGDPLPEPVFAGIVESLHGYAITGMARRPDDMEWAEVEFRIKGAPIGRAALAAKRGDGDEYEFAVALEVAGEHLVTAHRMPDDVELLNSPFPVAPLARPPAEDAPPGEPGPAWDTWLEEVKPLTLPKGAEAALFVTHTRTGVIRPHVAPYLRALRQEGVHVLLVAVGDRQINLTPDLLDLCAGAVVRGNLGYDFAAWAHVLKLYPELYGASLLYVLNDSVIGPADAERFAPLVARVRASPADLVALTESHEYHWHVQSYFLALKPRLLSSFWLHGFFGGMRMHPDKDAVIRACELPFAEQAGLHGHPSEVLFPSHVALNPTLFDWRGLIAGGFPFVKLLPLRGHFTEVDMSGWRETLDRAGFDVPLIEATIAASEEQAPAEEGHGLLAHVPPFVPSQDRPLKVAFYGPWNYDNGLGAAARGMIGALRRTGVRLNLHPIKRPFHIHRPLGPPIDVMEFEGRADIAIVHLNPDSWFLLTDSQRHAIRAARRRIGYWVWEMGHIPAAWWHDFSSVDRIWAPSAYCAELFAAQEEAPVDIIPHVVPLPDPAAMDGAGLLAGLGLAADARVILYIFDGASYLIRKNPAALIRAFAASGLAARGWRLVLKTKHLMDRPDAGAELAALADATDGAVLLDRPLPLAALEALRAAADIYASPHCSEGFGLTIAEAMAAGKAVVATDFGGSRDFLDAATGYPVTARPWRLEDDHGHYTLGGAWARIDEDALAQALVRAAGAVEAGDATIGRSARARIGETLSYDAVAAKIAVSFARIFTEHSRGPSMRRIVPNLERGVPIDLADLGPDIAAVALSAAGVAPAGPVAPGEVTWIALAPAGSLLAPDFTAILLHQAEQRPDVALFYGDDIAVDTAEPVDQIRLKPDFDATLLAAQDYVGAPLIIKAAALAALGGLDAAAGTAAAADLLFRAHEAGLSIARIPQVLLAHPAGRIRASDADHRAMLARRPELADHDLVPGAAPHSVIVRRRFEAPPPVTLLIPTRRSAPAAGGPAYVEQLLDALAGTDWPMDRLHVLIGDDIAGDPAWARGHRPYALTRIETVRGEGERFNYAAKMNRLWRAAETEQIVFLNDDVLPVDGGWLRALETFAVDRGVGGVGARLLFPDGRLQHAGMGPRGPAVAHPWIFRRREEGTYQDWATVQREWSMVTGAVFATRRGLMEEVGGFDEGFTLEFNDVDLCLRLRTLGYRIVCTPDALLTHVEKASRGEELPPGDEIARFLGLWSAWFAADPAWHPGLRRDTLDMMPALDPDAWYL